ncbi:MFS transporter [Trueperella abortisuis]|uniref:MFS transporter n=1 Tax=Trueperella abortisuis TaxID=445930 RepID=A0ABT9PH13_9ACTO|nr:MFS transporter [Trueperella abortisuis]MDP9832000.1 putative MFS transporter [Trueperella abortisuis]
MNDEPKVSLDDVGMSPFLVRLTVFSAGGPFLEGYVHAIIGVALLKMVPELGIDDTQKGMVGVAALVGLFFGAIFGGYLTDLIGRKRMFIIDVMSIAVLSGLCMVVSDPLMVVLLRFLIGVAVGADYPIATSIIAEFTPRRYRAITMGFLAAVWYLGANASYLVGYFLLNIDGGWRWMLGSSIIPCVIILAGRWSIPESPRWLMSKGRYEDAAKIVRDTFGRNVVIEDEVTERTSYSAIFRKPYFKRMIFVGVIWLCQAIPMFAVYTYGPDIIAAFGLGQGKTALIGELAIGTFFMLGTIPAMFLAEYWGRRPLCISSFVVMTGALVVLGVVPPTSMAFVIVIFGIYALASGGPGNLQWLYPNEIFPTSIRASAMGTAMAFSRISTVVSIFVLPGFLSTYGNGPMMIVGAAISLIGLIVSIAWAPETRGMTLTEAGSSDWEGK